MAWLVVASCETAGRISRDYKTERGVVIRTKPGLCAVMFVLFMGPVAAQAETSGDDGQCVVGVWNWTQASFSEADVRPVISEGCSVVGAEAIEKRMAGAGAGSFDADAVASWREQFEAGRRAFYYETAGAAVEKLERPLEEVAVQLGKKEPDAEFAGRIWDAGVMLIRAYLQEGRREEAAAQASWLTAMFPTGELRPREVPPEALAFIQERRAEWRREETGLRVAVDRGIDGCAASINGLESPVGETVSVASQRTYRLRSQCDGRLGAVVAVRIEGGETTSVNIPAPMSVAARPMERIEDNRRRAVGSYLEEIARGARLDRLVTVVGREGGQLVAVTTGADGETWGWGRIDPERRESDIRHLIGESSITQQGVEARDIEGGRLMNPATGVALATSGGAAFVGAGIYGLAVVAPRGRELACSPNNASGSGSGQCRGVDKVGFDSQADFEGAVSRFRLARGIAIGVGAVGLGVASVGVWQALKRSPERSEPTVRLGGIRIEPVISADAWRIQLGGKFH